MLKFLRKTYLYVLALPLLFILLGAVSNQLVLVANHDRFPVMVNSVKLAGFTDGHGTTDMLDSVHCVMTPQTHLNFLADIFDIRGEGIESIGDLAIDLGLWGWTFAPFIWGSLVIRKLVE